MANKRIEGHEANCDKLCNKFRSNEHKVNFYVKFFKQKEKQSCNERCQQGAHHGDARKGGKLVQHGTPAINEIEKVIEQKVDQQAGRCCAEYCAYVG